MSEQSKSPSPRTSDAELYQRGLLYDAVAKLMPLEGRDFTIEIQYKPMRARIIGKNDLGIAFAKHCQENLQATMQEIANESLPVNQQPTREEMMQSLARAFQKKGINAKAGPKRVKGASAGSPNNGSASTARPVSAGTAVPSNWDTAGAGEQHVL